MGKSKKKKDADWEDDVQADLEAIETGVEPPKKDAPVAAAVAAATPATAAGDDGAAVDSAVVGAATGSETASSNGKKNKKKKDKKKKDADWEDDVLAELDAIETGVEPPKKDVEPPKKDAPVAAAAAAAAPATAAGDDGAAVDSAVVGAATGGETASSNGKKNKKKKDKKKKDADWEDDILAELEAIETGVEPPKKDVEPPKKDATADGDDGAAVDTEKEEKEKDKKNKKKNKKKASATSESAATAAEATAVAPAAAAAAPAEGAAAPAEAAAAAESATADAEGADDGEDGEAASSSSKKKKKKDKKKPEEKKKEVKRKGGPGKGALAMMKAALEEKRILDEEAEAEQKRLEAEEEARINAAEEKQRIEKEKKEAKKLKEKLRRERQRQEGTLLTKAEKEKKKRNELHLEALRAAGIAVPSAQARDEEGKKVKVRYGSRARTNKQKQSPTEAGAEDAAAAAEAKKEEANVNVEADVAGADAEEDTAWDAELDDECGSIEQFTLPAAVKPLAGRPVAVETQKSKDSATAEEAASGSDEDDDEEEEEEDSEDEDDSSEDSSSSEESSSADESLTARERAEFRIHKRNQKFKEEQEKCLEFRAPVVCVLGHVDTGKTKILDKLRHTNVQDGEAGGITQQIGATNVTLEAIVEQTKMCKEFVKFDLKLPGLLIIDTPGHESFSNLRSRGSSLCDIAVVVVDIMHGLEPQTIESLNLLKNRKTPFVVALNKIDRLFEWRRNPQSSVKNTIAKQKLNTRLEFEERAKEVIVQFAEQGFNAALSFENKDLRNVVSLVPTSAISGDGMGDLIALLCELAQKNLSKQLAFTQRIHAQVLEVKLVHGVGMCLDVILVQGTLHEGQTIVLCGMDGAFSTSIRALHMPPPMKEFRVKNAYQQQKEVKAAQGVRIIGKDLEKSLAGTPLFVAYQPDEVDVLKTVQEATLKAALRSIKTEERGVYVQASTMGALEALLEFLKTSKIPYSGVSIGPVHKKDIMRCGVMLEHDSQYAVVLAFDVKVEREAQEMADSIGVKIFTADIIYHLFDAFTAYREAYAKKKQDEFKHVAVFPCQLSISPDCVFNKRDPIIVGVIVEEGTVHVGTPLCVPTKEFVYIGNVSSIEFNHKHLEVGKKGQEVCLKIDHTGGDAPKMVGRHFEATDKIVSRISRESIDACKNYFRDQMTRADWVLVKDLKKTFGIF